MHGCIDVEGLNVLFSGNGTKPYCGKIEDGNITATRDRLRNVFASKMYMLYVMNYPHRYQDITVPNFNFRSYKVTVHLICYYPGQCSLLCFFF